MLFAPSYTLAYGSLLMMKDLIIVSTLHSGETINSFRISNLNHSARTETSSVSLLPITKLLLPLPPPSPDISLFECQTLELALVI